MLFRRSTQERERRGRAARDAEDEYLGGDESFLDFCTYCDNQLPLSNHNSNVLYCSERCKQLDLPTSTTTYFPASPPPSPYLSPTTPSDREGRDIIPRASPTLSVPSLYTPPSALASLRSISSGIARRAERPSPPESDEDSDAVAWAWGKGKSYGGFHMGSPLERPPLPMRGGEYGYRYRPKSVDLITPVSVR